MVVTQVCLNPFPGLRSFEAHEEHLFFGREDQTDELLRRLGENRFLAVVGTSGSGKSSLVKAGLLPSLYSGFMTKAGSSWRVAVFRPGGNPIRNLARSLNAPNVLGSNAEDATIRTIITETTLRRASLGLVEVVRQAKMPSDENLLIIVDQFEELFRLEQSALRDNSSRDNSSDEAAAFVKLLLSTRQSDLPIYIVLTMRSDYLGDCARFRDLPEAINDSQYLIPRMTRDQRQLAITGPVAVGGATITPRLVNRLLNDLGDNPDQLPILQHALMRTWDYWAKHHKDGEPIDVRHYKAIGGMAEALSHHADEIYNNLPDARNQKIAEKLFKCLTDKGPRNLGIRHPTRLEEVSDVATAEKQEVIAVVNEFRGLGRSFLMPPENVELDENTVLDISHESLMRVWQRLKDWVDEERQSAQIYRRLAETSALYQQGRAGLLDDPELTIALNWREANKPNKTWAQRYAPEFELESVNDFLEKSKAARDEEIRHQQDEIKEKERRQQEKIRRQKEEIESHKRIHRRITSALVVAIAGLMVASGFGAVAFFSYIDALRALSASSEVLFTSNQQLDALVASIRAGKKLQQAAWLINDTALKADVIAALQQAVDWAREHNRLEAHSSKVYRVSFSPDGKMLASASDDNTIKLWKPDGSLLKTLKGNTSEVTSAVYDIGFSPDSKTLASASQDGTVKLWKPDGSLLKTLKGHTKTVYHVAFSPDGKTLASASQDGTVKLWKSDGSLLKTLKGNTSEVTSAVYDIGFSPDSKTLASASQDGTVKLWKLDGSLLKTLKGHTRTVYHVAFSPDGKTLASASQDGTVKLWKLDGSLLKTPPMKHEDWVWDVSFSPDGKTLASASRDGTVKLWQSNGFPLKTPPMRHRGEVYRVEFSWDGKALASASEDKTVKLWKLNGSLINTFEGHSEGVTSISFRRNDSMLASASYDNTVRLWQLSNKVHTALTGHNSWVSGVSFSPDGKTIASTSRDETIKLWKPDGTLLKTLQNHKDWVVGVDFNPDGKMLASASWDNTVGLWHLNGKLIKKLEGHKDRVSDVIFSPDGKTLASASYDHTIKLWRKSNGKLLNTFKGHRLGVVDIDFTSDGQMLASASDDKTVKLWNDDGTLNRTITGHGGQVYGVAFSPNGQILASAGEDGTVRLWRTSDGKLLNPLLKAHKGKKVYGVAFGPNGQILASAGGDGTVRLWRMSDGELLNVLKGHHEGVYRVSFSPDGKTLASTSDDKTVILWNVSNDLERQSLTDLLERSCDWVSDYLRTNPSISQDDSNICKNL